MNIGAWLRKLNTHKVFGVGVGTAFGSLAVITLGPKAQVAIDAAHVAPILKTTADVYIQAAINGAQAVLPPAILAAAYGRPPTIPQDPKPDTPSPSPN